MSDTLFYSKEGYKKLNDELENLVRIERPKISQQIADARDKGDLSENAEYDAAKQEQGLIELKISKLQNKIRDARIIDESQINTSKVSMLTTVTIKNLKNNATMSYKLVSENVSDVKSGKISVNSPIAKGLLGKVVGDIADIQVPAGLIQFEILEISID